MARVKGLLSFALIATGVLLALRLLHVGVPILFPQTRQGPIAVASFDEARKRRVGYELSLVLQGMWPVSCVNPSVLQNTALRRWQPVSMDRGPNS